MQARFIVFEGIDGCGKSTQLSLLAQKLRENGILCEETREPSDGTVGKLIRSILTGELKMNAEVLAPLFVADRLDHICNEKTGMIEMLRQGKSVLCDRYYFSSYAYQSGDVPVEWVVSANSLCREKLKPDLCLFIDISPEEALKRIAAGRDGTELFETVERLALARKAYFNAFDKGEENVEIIDGSGTPEEVSQRIWNSAAKFFNF